MKLDYHRTRETSYLPHSVQASPSPVHVTKTLLKEHYRIGKNSSKITDLHKTYTVNDYKCYITVPKLHCFYNSITVFTMHLFVNRASIHILPI